MVLAVDSVHAVRKGMGVDIASLLKLKLKVEPIRLHIDGGLWTRCNRFFHDINPRPSVHPRPDDARFQLVELDGLNVIADYVRALGLLATHGRIQLHDSHTIVLITRQASPPWLADALSPLTAFRYLTSAGRT